MAPVSVEDQPCVQCVEAPSGREIIMSFKVRNEVPNMPSERQWLKRRMLTASGVLFAGLLYLDGWIWGNRGDWARFACYLTGTLMLTIILAAELVRQKLDEKFERLEQLWGEHLLRSSEGSDHLPEPKVGKIPGD
jgi:hypothetical protein